MKRIGHTYKEEEMINRTRFDLSTLVPTLSAVLALLVHLLVPNSPRYTLKPLPYFTILLAGVIAVTLVLAALSLFSQRVRERYAFKSWFIAAFLLLLNLLNIATLKLMLLPVIYFPNPDRILKVFADDWAFILKCLGYSQASGNRVCHRRPGGDDHRNPCGLEQEVELLGQPPHQSHRADSLNRLGAHRPRIVSDHLCRQRVPYSACRLVSDHCIDKLGHIQRPEFIF